MNRNSETHQGWQAMLAKLMETQIWRAPVPAGLVAGLTKQQLGF